MHRRDFNIYNALGDVKSQNNRKVILITGPTASGKSELAIKTAIEKNGEIISADSMQIYKGMNIGTAKLRSNIPCHMIDIISINDKYSVYDYQKDAKENIRKVLEKGKLPIVCGGTGLYIDSLIYDLDYGGKESGKEKLLKEKLEDEYIKKGGGVLYEELKKINKTEAEKIHRNNTKKIIRTIIRLNNKDKMIPYKEANKLSNEFNFELKVLLPKNYDERKKLYDRIDDRVDKMIEDGLIDEVKNLFKENKSEKSAIYQAIGYKEIIPYLKNEANLEIAIEEIKKNTRHYAKRQITWMKKYLTLQKNL